MSMLALLATLGGAVLGLRLKVLVLIPALGATVVAAIAIGVSRGDAVPAVALAIVVASTCLQLGYLGGIAMRYAAVLARAGRLHKAAYDPKRPVAARAGGRIPRA